MGELAFGLFMYAIALLTMGGIYSVITLGLNVQWGFTGLFNAGIAGFFAIGAYTTAIVTTAPSVKHIGGFGLPVPVGLVAAMIVSAIVAYLIARLCLRLRADYLAIATIGIAEIFRLILKNEIWATNGPRGISNIPRPFENLSLPWAQLGFMAVVLSIVLAAYLLIQRSQNAPWGRVMRAIRDNEDAAAATGKDVVRFRVEAFVFGSVFMGLGGALTAHSFKFIGPEATEPLLTTFLAWVMLIAGGSGNNKGAIVGAILIWTIWSATELLTSPLPPDWAVRASFIRVFLIGLLLQVVLQRFTGGLLPEKAGIIETRPRPGRQRGPEPAE